MSDLRFLVACDGERGVASMVIEEGKPFLSNKDKADFLRRHAGYVFRIVNGDEMKRLMTAPHPAASSPRGGRDG